MVNKTPRTDIEIVLLSRWKNRSNFPNHEIHRLIPDFWTLIRSAEDVLVIDRVGMSRRNVLRLAPYSEVAPAVLGLGPGSLWTSSHVDVLKMCVNEVPWSAWFQVMLDDPVVQRISDLFQSTERTQDFGEFELSEGFIAALLTRLESIDSRAVLVSISNEARKAAVLARVFGAPSTLHGEENGMPRA